MGKIISAAIYLFTILWATSFTWLAENRFHVRRKGLLLAKGTLRLTKGTLFLIIAISLPCILAGIRGDNVGTDVLGYATKIVQETQRVDTFHELNAIDSTYTEIGYRFFAFLVSRAFSGLGWMLFFTELITIGCVAYALYLFRDEFSMALGMFFFMTCQYHLSFNAMRQMMASGMLLIAFYFLVHHKTIKFALVSLLAMSFHTFSIVVAGVLFIAWKFRGWLKKRWQKYLLIVGCLVVVLAWNGISQLLLRFSTGVFYRYARYFTNDLLSVPWTDVITSPALWVSILIFIICVIPIQNNNEDIKAEYDGILYLVLLLSLFGRLMQVYMSSMGRLGWYLFTFNCFLIPRSLAVRYRGLGRKTRMMILAVLMLSYWLFDCMLSGYSSTAVLTFRL